MNGLLSQGQGSPAPAPQAPTQPAPQAKQATSPEEQMYEVVVGQSAVWIYQEGLPVVRERLKAAEDPADAIGGIVGNLLAANVKSAGEQGKMIPPPIIVQGSMELISIVMEIAVKDGVVPEAEAKEEAAESFYEAMSIFGNEVGGSLDQDSRGQYAQAVDGAVKAEEEYRARNGGSLNPTKAPRKPKAPQPQRPAPVEQPEGV